MQVNTLGLMTVLSCLRNTALVAYLDTYLVKNPQQTTFTVNNRAAAFNELKTMSEFQDKKNSLL